MTAIVFFITGILFFMVPHFLLPMDLLSGGRGAWLLSDCSFQFHPETVSGIILILAAILRMKGKNGSVAALLAAAIALTQAAIMRPLSFYLHSEENLVILGQTYSMRGHSHIRETLVFLGMIIVVTVIVDILLRRRTRWTISLFNLSLSNIMRKLFRSTALVLALSVVIGAFFADVLLTDSISNTLELGAGRLGADLVVVPKTAEKEAREVLINGTPHIFNLDRGILETLKKWPEIEKISPQLFFRPFSYLVCCTTEQVLVVGYDPKTDFTIAPWVNYFLHKRQKNNEIVVGARVKFYPGQQISLFGNRLAVVASLDPAGIGYFDRSAFIPMTGAQELIESLKDTEKEGRLHKRKNMNDLSLTHLFDSPTVQKKQLAEVNPHGISVLMVKCRDGVAVKKIAARIEKELPSTAVVNVRAATISVKRQLTSMLDAFFLPIIILMGMGTVILAVVFSMSANERKREVGLLRAMGAKERDIFTLFLREAIMISILGGTFGVLGGGSIIILFKNRLMATLNLLYIWPQAATVAEVIIITLAASVLIGIIAGLFPAIRAARQEPYESFRAN